MMAMLPSLAAPHPTLPHQAVPRQTFPYPTAPSRAMPGYSLAALKRPCCGRQSQFNECLVARRRSLLAQAKALEQQRGGLLIEVAFIERVTGPKIVKRED